MLLGTDGVPHRPPADGVRAHQVAPVDAPPVGTEGIALEEQVIDAAKVDRRVGLVHPVLPGPAMILRLVNIAGEDILQPDGPVGDPGRVGGGHGGDCRPVQGAGLDAQLVHQAREHVERAVGDGFSVGIFADHQALARGGRDPRARRQRQLARDLPVLVQRRAARVAVEHGGHVIPAAAFQTRLSRPEGAPGVADAELEAEPAEAMEAQQRAAAVLPVILPGDGGQMGLAPLCRPWIVPLEGPGRDPGADGQRVSAQGHSLRGIDHGGGAAVEEQAAARDAAIAPLRLPGRRERGAQEAVLDRRVRQAARGVMDDGAPALVKGQMENLPRIGSCRHGGHLPWLIEIVP